MCIVINLVAFILRTNEDYDKDFGGLFDFMEISTTVVFTIGLYRSRSCAYSLQNFL